MTGVLQYIVTPNMNGFAKENYMLEQEYRIIEKLQAFNPENVLKAFELFKEIRDQEKENTLPELIKMGWISVREKPQEGTPFYYLFGNYWILPNSKKEEKIKVAKAKKTSMDIKGTGLKCPKCGGKLYKQRVCQGCKEGRMGYRIRLLCDENIDHEVLL